MNAQSQIGAHNKLICMRDCYRRYTINALHTCFMLVVQTHNMSPHAALRTATVLAYSVAGLWLDRTYSSGHLTIRKLLEKITTIISMMGDIPHPPPPPKRKKKHRIK